MSLALVCFSLTSNRVLIAVEPISSGLNQIVVIPPDQHELGLPAVSLEPAATGTISVELPPTLHVHRYYYDGDREFQGPIIQGGPTIIVASHPCNGKRVQVSATLPQGAPLVVYTGRAITYVYPDRRVKISFGRLFSDRVRVDYLGGQGIARKSSSAIHHVWNCTCEAASESATVQSVADAASGSVQLLGGVRAGLDDGLSATIDLLKQGTNFIPGVSTLKGKADDAAQSRYSAKLRGLTRQKETSSIDLIRINQ